MPSDPYWKLRPAPPTPADEICQCETLDEVALVDRFGENPICCLECRGEVPPERLGFDARLADDLAQWRQLRRALLILELDSGEYEHWAALQLADPNGQVNRLGLELTKRLGAHVPTRYWWFIPVEQSDSNETCPICASALIDRPKGNVRLCDPCRIVC